MLASGTPAAERLVRFLGIAAVFISQSVFGDLAPFGENEAADSYDYRIWTKTDGLPDNEVQCLLQSRDGYLWIGTRKGLGRFDGVKFTVFNQANTPSMEEDDCRNLGEDLQGNLWIGTRSKLFRFDKQGLQPFQQENGFRGGPRYHLHSSGRTGFWIGSYQWLNNLRDGKMTHYGAANGLFGEICALEEDRDGKLWIGLNGALQTFTSDTATFSTNYLPAELSRAVQTLRCDGQGRLWASLTETILQPLNDAPIIKEWVYQVINGKLQSCPGNPHSNDGRPFFFLPDQDDNIWMPAAYGRVARIQNGKLAHFSLAGPGQKSYAQCGLADREGNIWFGTEGGGLQRWTVRKVRTFSTEEGLAHSNTWALCQTRDGSVWVGGDGGLSQFKSGLFANFTQKDGLLRKEVRSVVQDRTGVLWVGTMNGLFFRCDQGFSKYEFPGEWFEGKIRTLLPTEEGTVWVGTAVGLKAIRDSDLVRLDTPVELARLDVRALLQDRRGGLWIGTAGTGVKYLHEKKLTSFSTTNGLSSDFAWALHEDGNGAIWIGTENGLNRVKGDSVARFTTNEGLPDNLVNYILEDDFNRLWVSHDRGIYWVALQDLNNVADGRAESVRCVRYDESDGLLSLETNGQKSNPAGCKTQNGHLWFPTTQGVAVIDPQKVTLDATEPLAAIEIVRANGTIVFDNRLNAGQGNTNTTLRPIANSVHQTLTYQLAPGSARVLEFHFTANTFVAPEKARFKYRILGLNENWIDAGARREAYFTDLRPGNYLFEVIAANHRGVWQEKGAMFGFSLAPFMYQRWWFYPLCGSTAILLLASIVIWRVRELRRIHRLQQQAVVVAERERIAKDLHDGLGADLTRLTLLADLAADNSTDSGREHLQKLSKSSREVVRELKQLIWIVNPASDTADGLLSRICQNAEDFLRDSGIARRFEIARDLPQQPLSLDQRRNLLLVAREALNNVVKHARASQVTIRACRDQNNLELAFEDNGCGFDPDSASGDGMGLDSMRRRVEAIPGKFRLESRPGFGARILIIIPFTAPKND